MKKILFITTGSLLSESKKKPVKSSLEELSFSSGVFRFLPRIASELNFELVLLSKLQDAGIHNFIVRTLENEGVKFGETIELSGKKPLPKYSKSKYDLQNSYVISTNAAEEKLSGLLGCKSINLNGAFTWQKAYEILKGGERKAKHQRVTKETSIAIELDLDGTGKAEISTGLHFFDHMLEQIAKHGGIDLKIVAKGDLHIDEHHTIEDTAITLGETFIKALGDKRGIERYGFCLPMDEALAQVAIDFGGRNWIVWKAKFKRDKVGDVPTEMFFHFFKSFSDAAKCNLNIKVEGKNDHHKIEAIFKAFAKAIKMAVKRDVNNLQLPSTKGVL